VTVYSHRPLGGTAGTRPRIENKIVVVQPANLEKFEPPETAA
jgi:hypothetical protein